MPWLLVLIIFCSLLEDMHRNVILSSSSFLTACLHVPCQSFLEWPSHLAHILTRAQSWQRTSYTTLVLLCPGILFFTLIKASLIVLCSLKISFKLTASFDVSAYFVCHLSQAFNIEYVKDLLFFRAFLMALISCCLCDRHEWFWNVCGPALPYGVEYSVREGAYSKSALQMLNLLWEAVTITYTES